MATPAEILDIAFGRASSHLAARIVDDPETAGRVEYICRSKQNRAGVTLPTAKAGGFLGLS